MRSREVTIRFIIHTLLLPDCYCKCLGEVGGGANNLFYT